MNDLQALKQKYLEDGRPNVVSVIDEAIAVTNGEYGHVLTKADAIDGEVGNEIAAIALNDLAAE